MRVLAMLCARTHADAMHSMSDLLVSFVSFFPASIMWAANEVTSVGEYGVPDCGCVSTYRMGYTPCSSDTLLLTYFLLPLPDHKGSVICRMW